MPDTHPRRTTRDGSGDGSACDAMLWVVSENGPVGPESGRDPQRLGFRDYAVGWGVPVPVRANSPARPSRTALGHAPRQHAARLQPTSQPAIRRQRDRTPRGIKKSGGCTTRRRRATSSARRAAAPSGCSATCVERGPQIGHASRARARPARRQQQAASHP
ncbi:hypothetical protein HYPSUDRAFT_201282 [Hypholoma sublateritium FD-334 SS-4]|uniref:Uncharacterized protein n=1 Tax=Hypholoma sublateritium (strain FD-334 SS-4) TaxID=945553 RepID=A0A0D2MIR4_HYPSF|nr:hypothetical protein HYPSUDRAFT_201282 [Hypholoma sublateritium FD-334 SS-4]